jgi:nucleoside-diphosphate-sugar epimerase
VNIVRGDVSESSSLIGKMTGHDVVLHLAGSVGYQSWKNCVAINQIGTRNAAAEAVNTGIRRFVYMSSVAVYGRVPGIPITEETSTKKIRDPYGDTKIEAEKALKEYEKQGRLDLTILQPTVVYGENDNKFIPQLLRNLKSNKYRVIGDGNNRVDLIYVEDLAQFVLSVLRERKTIGQTYIVTNPNNPSWNEFLDEVCRFLGLPQVTSHIPYKLAYTAAWLMELAGKLSGKTPRLSRYAVRIVGLPCNYVTAKAEKELGFRPSINLIDGIKRCLS